MSKRTSQRRPSGVEWVCDERFVRALRDVGGTAADVAAAVSESCGYEIDDSMIRKMRGGKVPSSALVGAICRHYGWPMPPLARADTELVGDSALGTDAASIYELGYISPERREHVSKVIEDALFAARAQRDREGKGGGDNGGGSVH